jgi:CRP/FNR family cyclic AMP-dependent transcriptional regulator
MDPDRLKQIPLFAELSRRELEELGRWADELDVTEGRALVEQGDFGYEFFAILEGTVEVRKDGEKVTELGPGDFFGEVALVEPTRRNATVVATTPLKVAVMTKRDFLHLQDDAPEVCRTIHRAIRERS